MDIKLWKSIGEFVGVNKYPSLPCPFCGEIDLEMDSSSLHHKSFSENFENKAKYLSRHHQAVKEKEYAEEIKQSELIKSASEKDTLSGLLSTLFFIASDAFKDNYELGQFAGFMQCNSCNEYLSISGLSQKKIDLKDNEPVKPIRVKVENFGFPILMFDINQYVPEIVERELHDAFRYFHFDPNSSAAKLRRAIESFCHVLDSEGKSLHQQINNLPERFSMEKRFLQTLRLVGNEGTHADGVDEDDLLQAFDIFHNVLSVFTRLHELQALESSHEILSLKFDKKLK